MNCLIIGKVWPEPTSTAAGRRTLDLITAMLAEDVASATSLLSCRDLSCSDLSCSDLSCSDLSCSDLSCSDATPVASTSDSWQIHFACAAQRGAHALDLKALGVSTHIIAVNDSTFDSWIKSLAPDVVIFDRFMIEEQFGWRVAQHCPEALRVLDTSDLHCLRVAREHSLNSGKSLDLKNETALREIAAIYRSDLTLMISEFEMEILRNEFAIADELLAYWPFAISLKEPTPDFDVREHFILIGSFLHPPNLDAARWCKQAIWPKIRDALPEAELHCYGSYGERYAAELHAPKDGFYFKGRADDAQQTMAQYRINLAPLRYGAGLKGKVFDGFQTGTPTVMTPIAAEGICPDKGWSHEEADAFAASAVDLYRDSKTWHARQVEELALCQVRFGLEHWQPRLLQSIRVALGERDQQRQQNFIGQMLRHHQHRSTEFMSRWIEAKNQ